MNIGDKIKEERLKKEWTQEHLAQLLNVSRPTISSWEVGRNYPDLETIIAISDFFGISLDNLLREDKEMAKETTKKIKRGKTYKTLLIVFGCLFLLYFAYNAKLRVDEHTYRENLANQGWRQLSEDDGLTPSKNAYELIEDDIHYWTYILPAGWIGFPLAEQKLALITNKEDFYVTVDYDGKIEIKISPQDSLIISKQLYVATNENGELTEKNPEWSTEYKKEIVRYLYQYQDVHKELIENSFKKIASISGK